jgi:prepilin-type processing-associated H-X9-DG protein/prepilin-type N-terminal cleavage/methylation domain-containing protein
VQRPAKGFTLIELLVVIVIIMILFSVLFPVFARAREKAYSAKCQANLRSLGIALRMYVDANDGRYPRGRAVYLSWEPPVRNRDQYTGVSYPGSVYTVMHEYLREERILECPSKSFSWWYTYRACGDAYRFSYPYNWLCWADTLVKVTDPREPAKQVLLTEGYHLWFDAHEQIYDRLGAGWFEMARYGSQYETAWHNGRVNVLWGDGHVESKRLDQLYYYNFYRNSRERYICPADTRGDCMRPITDGY